MGAPCNARPQNCATIYFSVAFIAAICLNLSQIIVSEHTETVGNDCVGLYSVTAE